MAHRLPPSTLALAILLAASPTPAQICTPTTPVARQYRTGLKHRAPGPATAPVVTIAAMQAWPGTRRG